VTPNFSPAYRRFAVFVVAWTVLLVWWGAAVTTENVGLAVPDWPLAFNRINPEGWWKHLAYLLEHGHRWLATILTGLVMVLFFWTTSAVRPRPGRPAPGLPLTSVELVAVVLLSFGIVAAVAFNQSPRVDPEFVPVFGWLAVILSAICLGWLIWSLAVRRWSTPIRLLAVVWVVLGAQAILGGTRVTRLSDALAIFHGCLGQLLFCLLLAIVLVTSPRWPSPGLMAGRLRSQCLLWGGVFSGAVLVQLVLGATIRHTQRSIPAALDVFTTGGQVWPGFDHPERLLLFAHKAWALVVFSLGLTLAIHAWRHLREHSALRRIALGLPVLLCVQIGLGVSVLMTMDRFKVAPNTTLTQLRLSPVFWVTNLHVLTGLTTLACAFVFLVKVVAATPHRGMVAPQSGANAGPSM
jgi:heme A synthase